MRSPRPGSKAKYSACAPARGMGEAGKEERGCSWGH